MPTVAVVGPGAIGGVLAAHLARAPQNHVVLCARTPFERLRVELPDAREIEPALRVIMEPSPAGPANVSGLANVEWILVTTKAYDTVGAARWIAALRGEATRLAVAQNGVEHATRFATLVPAHRTLPVICDLSAERLAPGVVRQRSQGSLTVPSGELGRAFAALLEGSSLAVSLSADWTTAAWRKLALNCAGAIQALTRRPAGVIEDPAIADVARGLAAEAIAVGRAEGANLAPSLADEVVARMRRSDPSSTNSLLADLRAGRPLETEARNGVVVRRGAHHGIPTPLNTMAVAILGAHEARAPLLATRA